MENIIYSLILISLIISKTIAAPRTFREDFCSFASSISVTAYGAAGANDTFAVDLDNMWHIVEDGKFP